MMKLRWQSKIFPQQHASSRWPLSRYIVLVALFILLFSVLTAMIVEWRVSPVMRAWAETRAVSLATRAISLAIEETMAISISTTEMSTVISDDQGQIQAIQYNTGEINRVTATATHKVLQFLSNLGEESFPIPIGQILGLDFLAAWGPQIPVRVIPTGSVMTTPISSFHAAGINQTIHRIYLNVEVEMRIVVPITAIVLPVSTRFPIVEEIIIGSVPSWYFAPGGIVGGFDTILGEEPSIVEFELNNLGLR